ncbi:MAG: aminopeptidase P N-terminal domain-containing protein, partial [Flavobacteriales bacterium]
MKSLKFLFILFITISLNYQAQTPTDFLSKEFHKEKREFLRAKMPENSVTVVFANPLRNRANDVDYVFHQDPNFYYLTGYREPNGVLVLFSDNQTDEEGNSYNEILYVQERDERAEQWNGKRLGVEGAKKELGFEMAMNGSEFLKSNIDFKNFNNVYIEKFNDDYRDLGGADVFNLVKNFKMKAGYDPSLYLSRMQEYVYNNIAETPIESSANVINIIDRLASRAPEINNDELIKGYKSATTDELKKTDISQHALDVLENSKIKDIYVVGRRGPAQGAMTSKELK